MRDSLRSWLERAQVEADDAAETVLAVWEACANAVEHAQEPSESWFRLRARLDDAGLMRVEVHDTGRWKPGDGSADRGLGLGLMRSLMDSVHVRPGEGGTEVVLERMVQVLEARSRSV
jgi:anti-sigma regulatory factor (Ser/Thr protein kinase)